MVKNRIHAVLAKNGVKYEFSDFFGEEGTNFLKEIDIPYSQKITLDVLLRQLESTNKEDDRVSHNKFIPSKDK